jgi:hypothetical protein
MIHPESEFQHIFGAYTRPDTGFNVLENFFRSGGFAEA